MLGESSQESQAVICCMRHIGVDSLCVTGLSAVNNPLVLGQVATWGDCAEGRTHGT